jgi:hypothetical protein
MLRPQTNYRMGVYGAGWSIILVELSWIIRLKRMAKLI